MNWRNIAAAALILAAFTLLVTVWLFTEIQDQRVDAVRGGCVTNNRQNAVLDRLLDASVRARARERRPLTAEARRELRRARRALRPVDCDRLPVERPVPWR